MNAFSDVTAQWDATVGARYGVRLQIQTTAAGDFTALTDADLPATEVRVRAIADALALYPPGFILGSELEQVLLYGLPRTATIGSAYAREVAISAHWSAPADVSGLFQHEMTHALMDAAGPAYRGFWRDPDGEPTRRWTSLNDGPYGPYRGPDAPGWASEYAPASFLEDTAETAKGLWDGTILRRLPDDPRLLGKARMMAEWFSAHGLTRFDAAVGLPPPIVPPPVVTQPEPPPPAAPPPPVVPEVPPVAARPAERTYLQVHTPRRQQCRWERRQRPTGLTVVHTTESALDVMGPDAGAEKVAAFIAARPDPGSYHDLVDSDSALQLLPYTAEAYQDGTGSNPYALSIAFACRAADWPRMTVIRRDAFLIQGARAYRRQQSWLAENRYPSTPLRRVTREQSVAGVAGFIGHGERDPGRRSDPGAQFPWDRFFQLCSYAVAQPPKVTEAPSMLLCKDPDSNRQYVLAGNTKKWITSTAALAAYERVLPRVVLDAAELATYADPAR